MKCTYCNEEIDDNASFCQHCGKKLNDNSTSYCPKCGELTKSNVSFCSNCGHEFTNNRKVSNVSNSSPEFILGLIGVIIGFILCIIALFNYISFHYIGTYTSEYMVFIASIIGIIGIFYLKKNRQLGAIVMILSAVIYFLALITGWLCCFFVGLGALLALFKD